MTINYLPPGDAVTLPDETGSGWIARFLRPGDPFGRGTLQHGFGGIEFSDGSMVIGDLPALAALGHALVMRFDPPGFDDVEAAGLCGNGTDGTGPHNWPTVARAALRRPVFIAETRTAHDEWIGTGATADEARDSLLHAWYEHARHSGADPHEIHRDEIGIRGGVIGTAWCDFHAIPRPPRS